MKVGFRPTFQNIEEDIFLQKIWLLVFTYYEIIFTF